MRTVFAVEVLMLLHVRNIPLALGEQLCDILCGVFLGFIETRAARKRIANLDMNAVRVAITLARCECALVERYADDNLFVIDRRVTT